MTRLLILGIGLTIAHAAEFMAPDFQVQTKHGNTMVNLDATPPPRHHFNAKAPMNVLFGKKKILPSESSEQRVRFNIQVKQLPDSSSDGIVSLYLCDDANTYCERHEVPVSVNPNSRSR